MLVILLLHLPWSSAVPAPSLVPEVFSLWPLPLVKRLSTRFSEIVKQLHFAFAETWNLWIKTVIITKVETIIMLFDSGEPSISVLYSKMLVAGVIYWPEAGGPENILPEAEEGLALLSPVLFSVLLERMWANHSSAWWQQENYSLITSLCGNKQASWRSIS